MQKTELLWGLGEIGDGLSTYSMHCQITPTKVAAKVEAKVSRYRVSGL